MKRARTFALAAGLAAGLAVVPVLGQDPAEPPPQTASTLADSALDAEKRELAAELREAQTSPLDMIRALEAHLRKYPNTEMRPEIMPLLAKEAVEVSDTRRIALYGVPALEVVPNDAQLLDRVSAALLNLGGRENAEKALDYGNRLEEFIANLPVVDGTDPARNQEDHDRSLARALVYQARALGILGRNDEARKRAQLAYIAYADEQSAREWSDALKRLGDDQQTIERLADAFAISDPHATEDNRALDRKELGEMYRKLHNGSETGLGDEILAAYDRTSATIEKRRAQLRLLDPNAGLTDPMKFTLRALERDQKLEMASLKGKVLILDFWATWCVPCRAQHPLYDQVKKRFQDRSDVLFLSINAVEDRDLISHFLDQQKWSRMVYLDSGLV